MIWVLAVFFPLFLVCLILIPRLPSRLYPAACALGGIPALALGLLGADLQPVQIETILLGAHLGFGEFGRPFLLLTSLVWTGAGLFSAWSMRSDSGQGKFTIFFLLAMCGNIGLTVAQDIITFYLFFALMTFSAYVLVVHNGTEKAGRAGNIYLIMAVIGEGLITAGLMLAAFMGESILLPEIAQALSYLPQHHPMFWMLFVGFGIKAGVLLLHFWLPLAHPVAPTPASAVLSGAMIKAGLLGWMHFFPLGLAQFELWGSLFIILGLLGAFFGVLAGLMEKDPKTVLAYSSVSQMGLMTFLCGLALFEPRLWGAALPGLIMFATHHGLAKASLFLGVAVSRTIQAKSLMRPVFTAALTLPALTLAGFTFTSGSRIKYLMKDMVSAGPWPDLTLFLLYMSSLATTLLMAHFICRIRASAEPGQKSSLSGQIWVWAALIGLVALLPWLLQNVYPGLPEHSWLDPGFIQGSVWPVLLGGAVFLWLRNRDIFGKSLLDKWPDMAEVMEKAWRRAYARWQASWLCDPDCVQINFVHLADRFIYSRPGILVPCIGEARFRSWLVIGASLVFLALLLAWLAI